MRKAGTGGAAAFLAAACLLAACSSGSSGDSSSKGTSSSTSTTAASSKGGKGKHGDRPAGPAATIAGPLTGGKGPFIVEANDTGPARKTAGYVEQEYTAS